MNLAFLCASAEPGRDGVGDYTRRLAAACADRGHSVLVLALHDRQVSAFTEETPGPGWMVRRWPATRPWRERHLAVHLALHGFAPGWISWQLVAYGYHPKGVLPPEITALARELSAFATHVMLHEIWIGLARGDSCRARWTGWRQRRALLGFLAAASPRHLHTSNRSYATALDQHGHAALVLPVFGNIPVAPDAPTERARLLAQHLPAVTGGPAPLLGVTFGTLHPQWAPEATARFLLATARGRGRPAALLALGRTGRHGPDLLQRLARAGLGVHATGELPPVVLSHLLQAADLGIAAHPRALIAKSGAVAAMLDHGLPVLLPRDDWQLRRGAIPAPPHDPRFALLDGLDAAAVGRWLCHRPPAHDSLSVITGVFLHALTA